MTRDEAQKAFHEKLVDLARCFYDTEYSSTLSSVTYVELGCSYSGDINPMEVHIFYKNGRPEPKKEIE
jgi:hypothetical protein